MKKASLYFCLLMLLLNGGCEELDLRFDTGFWSGISLHPFYTDQELVFDEELLGSWGDDSGFCKFEKYKEDNYILTITEDTSKAEFIAHLVDINNMLFLDVLPAKPFLGENFIQEAFYVPGYALWKIEQNEDTLELCFMDGIVDILENDPNQLKHEIVDEDNLLLTASTEDLQNFIKQHANNKALFSECKKMKRFVCPDPNDPNDPNCIDVNSQESK